MVFHGRLSDSKSPQVSRTLLSILVVFNNAVVWMVSTRLPTSKSSRTFNNPLVTVPKAPITFGIIVTFMFHSFFSSLARSWYLSPFSHSFQFYSVDGKVDNFAILLLLSLLMIIINFELAYDEVWVEHVPDIGIMVRVCANGQGDLGSYQRLKKWYLMSPCLTLSIIRYGSRVKWSNPVKRAAPSPTPWCSSYQKREPSYPLD